MWKISDMFLNLNKMFGKFVTDFIDTYEWALI